MSISIKLVDSFFEIQRQAYKEISKELNKNLIKNNKKAQLKVQALIPAWIKEQPEVASILDDGILGSLNAQFGFVSGTAGEAINSISLAVAAAVKVEFSKITDKLRGGVTFYLQPSDFLNVLSLPEANIPALSGPLPWLYWLLTQGNNTIVFGYRYEADTSGRSGGGVMEAGSAWRVPAQFSGTPDNNFITRALKNREKELTSILREALYV